MGSRSLCCSSDRLSDSSGVGDTLRDGATDTGGSYRELKLDSEGDELRDTEGGEWRDGEGDASRDGALEGSGNPARAPSLACAAAAHAGVGLGAHCRKRQWSSMRAELGMRSSTRGGIRLSAHCTPSWKAHAGLGIRSSTLGGVGLGVRCTPS